MPTNAAETPDAMIGRTLAERYELVERLGEGLSGTVYRALQWPLRRSVAVKVMSRERAEKRAHVERFIEEARILSALPHPYTVGLIELGSTEGGRPFIVTEYIGGGTLRDLMAGHRVAPALALGLARQIATALADAHSRGIIHRDLKPENVLLERVRSGELVARLIDFGLASSDAGDVGERDAASTPARRVRVGTPGYISPEQAFFRPVGPATDLYALGAMLFEMLTGHPVFEADSREALYLEHAHSAPLPLSEMAPDLALDRGVEELVLSLLAKDPAERPSAEEVVARLRSLGARTTPAAPRVTRAPPRPPRAPQPVVAPAAWRANRYVVSGALLGGLVVGLVGLLFGA